MTVHGDGSQTRDFVFVGDVVKHLIAGMQHLADQPGAYLLNVCTGQETSVAGLAAAIGVAPRRAPVIRRGPPRPGDIAQSVGSPRLAALTLGIKARTSLADGLAATLAALPVQVSPERATPG